MVKSGFAEVMGLKNAAAFWLLTVVGVQPGAVLNVVVLIYTVPFWRSAKPQVPAIPEKLCTMKSA